MTEPPTLQQLDRTFVRFQNRRLSFFSGCDYYRLASRPEVRAAVDQGLRKFGLNVAASRQTTGNHRIYAELEARLADFFSVEQALLTPSGYLTNLIVAQALAGSFSHAIVDARAHPSLADAARLLDCPVLAFGHRDISGLAEAVRRCGPGAKLILLTDGMFGHDGSSAPLAAYLKLLPRDGVILVDDAHGAGVLGATGQGTPEHEGVHRRRIIQTITLSKAFGVYGGAILGPTALRHRILRRSNMFVGSTPLPLPLASAALCSVRLLRRDKALRARLRRNTRIVKEALAGSRSAEARTSPSLTTPGPTVAVFPESKRASQDLNRRLLAAGIYPPLVNYPCGPEGGYYRFVVSSEHTRDQLDRLIEVFA